MNKEIRKDLLEIMKDAQKYANILSYEFVKDNEMLVVIKTSAIKLRYDLSIVFNNHLNTSMIDIRIKSKYSINKQIICESTEMGRLLLHYLLQL